MYTGYVPNQKNGTYDGMINDMEIINKIIGLNAIVIEKRFVEKHVDGIKKEDAQMTLFEFKAGKISRIFEYW